MSKKLVIHHEKEITYVFLYAGLESKYMYWEGIRYAKKILLIAFILLAGIHSEQFQIYISLYVLGLFYAL